MLETRQIQTVPTAYLWISFKNQNCQTFADYYSMNIFLKMWLSQKERVILSSATAEMYH